MSYSLPLSPICEHPNMTQVDGFDLGTKGRRERSIPRTHLNRFLLKSVPNLQPLLRRRHDRRVVVPMYDTFCLRLHGLGRRRRRGERDTGRERGQTGRLDAVRVRLVIFVSVLGRRLKWSRGYDGLRSRYTEWWS